ncbi:hypothetical protein JK358_08675 [Nocardia sp. 2]|uniref:Uncharacterized protein n=1 Tax=Nocardia acididurans TaxID=2802282 RepID=A0ABS1M2R3_9NOCA|nr:hypothetical protein [Nocardia acididurans]MBL1074470.1 hypothetical protein [Nocardia acididurans]
MSDLSDAMQRASEWTTEMRQQGAASKIRQVEVRQWGVDNEPSHPVLFVASYYDPEQGLTDELVYAARVHDWHNAGYRAWQQDWGPEPVECPHCGRTVPAAVRSQPVISATAASPVLARARPRPVSTLGKLYKPYYEQLLRCNPSIRDFIEKRDSPEHCYRWLVELDCGCVTDAVTVGHVAAHVAMDELRPSDCVFTRYLGESRSGVSTDNVLLFGYGVSWKHQNWSKGFAWCAGHVDNRPLREITEWVEREQRPGFYSQELERQLEPFASWTVMLSCGHYESPVVTELDWRPEHGFREQSGVARDGKLPSSMKDCRHCVYMRRVTGARSIGPLARPKVSKPPQPPSRRTLTRRLNAAEASARALREQLAQVEQETVRLRSERDQAK